MNGQPLILRPGGTGPGSEIAQPPPGRCPWLTLKPARIASLAPDCFSRGFARTHSPFIPPSPARRNPWLAALAAKGIPAHLDQSRPYDVIWVPKAHGQRAAMELKAYESVNADWPRRRAAKEAGAGVFSHDALCASILLQAAILRFHLWIARSPAGEHWLARGLWDPQAIAAGQWWRCLTALTLHHDLAHVTANALWGFLFGTLVATRMGVGLAALLMVLAGALGNATMALVGGAHRSLGASTMVFGLLGILAATHTRREWRQRQPGRGLVRIAPAIPMVFAVGTAALYGAAPGADALAHACGFAWGTALGFMAEGLARRRDSMGLQLAAAAVAAGSVAAAWTAAMTP